MVSDSEFGSVALMQQVTGPGQSIWYEGVLLTGAQAHRCNLLIHWEPDEKDPWLLATSYATPREALQAYRRRMWIDQTHDSVET